MRKIEALILPGAALAEDHGALPKFLWVDPTTLVIDDSYQRDLSEKSVKLIRKIATGFDWTKYTPPRCAHGPDGLEIMDGQHTAIGAASAGIVSIPVMVVEAYTVQARADAFVSHNRNRLALSPLQIHRGDVRAGNDEAADVEAVCKRAGVTIVQVQASGGRWKPGETMAISSIQTLVRRRGVMQARIVMQTIADAHVAPIRAHHIKAIETLLHDDEYKGAVTPADLTSALMRLGDDIEKEAAVFAATHGIKIWRGMVTVLFRAASKRRRAS